MKLLWILKGEAVLGENELVRHVHVTGIEGKIQLSKSFNTYNIPHPQNHPQNRAGHLDVYSE